MKAEVLRVAPPKAWCNAQCRLEDSQVTGLQRDRLRVFAAFTFLSLYMSFSCKGALTLEMAKIVSW